MFFLEACEQRGPRPWKLLAPRLFVEPVTQGPPKPAQEFLPHATANAARETRFLR